MARWPVDPPREPPAPLTRTPPSSIDSFLTADDAKRLSGRRTRDDTAEPLRGYGEAVRANVLRSVFEQIRRECEREARDGIASSGVCLGYAGTSHEKDIPGVPPRAIPSYDAGEVGEAVRDDLRALGFVIDGEENLLW